MIDQIGHPPKPGSPVNESQVWVCVLVTVDGIETWACRTERLALRELASACRHYWDDARYVERCLHRDPDLPPLPPAPPDDDRTAVERYFAVMGKALPPESFAIAPQAMVGDDPCAYCPECHAEAKAGSRNRISATHCEYECPDGHGFFTLREPGPAGGGGGR